MHGDFISHLGKKGSQCKFSHILFRFKILDGVSYPECVTQTADKILQSTAATALPPSTRKVKM